MELVHYFLEHNRYSNFFGIAIVLGIAFLFSKNRKHISYKTVVSGLVMQFFIGVLVLKTTIGISALSFVAQGIKGLYSFADVGVNFVFGALAQDVNTPWGFIFGVKVLPVIIFFGAFTSLLFHWGILQKGVGALACLVQPVLGVSGAEALCAVANSFLGQTEAPLVIRSYLSKMTKSEMFVVMVSGMATISGAIMGVFAMMGVPLGHMLAASVMSIPASILIAKMLYPETEQSETGKDLAMHNEQPTGNMLDAISRGTSDGLSLAVNVAAMLISFLAFLALFDYVLFALSYCMNAYIMDVFFPAWQFPELNLAFLFSYVFAPFGYLLGLRGEEALKAGQLLGTKVAVNELIAYSSLLSLDLSDRAVTILTYALCGFSNFSCIGIQIGGIGALVPEKRAWLTELGLYAVLGGALTNLLSAMMAALLL